MPDDVWGRIVLFVLIASFQASDGLKGANLVPVDLVTSFLDIGHQAFPQSIEMCKDRIFMCFRAMGHLQKMPPMMHCMSCSTLLVGNLCERRPCECS